MCDYSLHAERTRDAAVGDVLVVHQFNLGTKGMKDVNDHAMFERNSRACAVCMKPGTELSLTAPVVELYRWPAWCPVFTGRRKHKHATATFRKIEPTYDWAPSHRDAIEFPDGTKVLITNLEAGQVMSVLQVPAEAKRDVRTSDDWDHLYAESL